MSPPVRPTWPLRALAVLPAVLLVSATVATAGVLPESGDSLLGPLCIHDEILEAQFGNLTLDEISSSGQFTTTAVLEAPSSDVSSASSGGYAPIRIKVFYEDVFDPTKYCTEAGQVRPDFKNGSVTCTDKDVLTPEKQQLLVKTMIPKAVMMHSQRLSVQPLQSLYVSQMTGSVCGNFAVPSDVRNKDISDADFVLFVAAGPMSGPSVAWATPCCYIEGERRPVVGVVNVKPRYITDTSQSIRTVAHEIMHALGFSGPQFQAHDMVAVVEGLRGKPTTPVVNTPNTLAKAKEHFNCSTMPGMELHVNGSAGTAGSHWSFRNARDDLMCGYAGPMMRYSAITIAAMEDLGFYKGNYAMAEQMPSGYHSGCTLIDEKCIVNEVSNYPNMFCDFKPFSRPALRCSADRMGLGDCRVFTFNTTLPTYYQYFSNPEYGGDPAVEYCPIVVPYLTSRCLDGTVSDVGAVGPTSRCISPPRSAIGMATCVDVECNSTSSTYRVRFKGGERFIDCPAGSQFFGRDTTSPLIALTRPFECPHYLEMCANMIRNRNAAASRGAPGLIAMVLPALLLAIIAS